MIILTFIKLLLWHTCALDGMMISPKFTGWYPNAHVMLLEDGTSPYIKDPKQTLLPPTM
jgi:hypothetical protein